MRLAVATFTALNTHAVKTSDNFLSPAFAVIRLSDSIGIGRLCNLFAVRRINDHHAFVARRNRFFKCAGKKLILFLGSGVGPHVQWAIHNISGNHHPIPQLIFSGDIGAACTINCQNKLTVIIPTTEIQRFPDESRCNIIRDHICFNRQNTVPLPHIGSYNVERKSQPLSRINSPAACTSPSALHVFQCGIRVWYSDSPNCRATRSHHFQLMRRLETVGGIFLINIGRLLYTYPELDPQWHLLLLKPIIGMRKGGGKKPYYRSQTIHPVP